jgi:hypothetical protein
MWPGGVSTEGTSWTAETEPDAGMTTSKTHRVGRRWRLLLASLVLIAAGGPTAKAAYWNVFNVEGESSATAQIVTYDTLAAC